MIHQQLGIKLRDPSSSCNRSETLAKIVTPFRQRCPIFLLLDKMSRVAVSRKYPFRSLRWVLVG